MTEKFIINQNAEVEDTISHITFDSFMEILIVLNGQSRQLKKLSEENEQLLEENEQLRSEYQRLRRKNKRLHQDWDKMYRLCLDEGFTEDEIIKELER